MLERTISGNLQIVHSYNQIQNSLSKTFKKKQELILFRPAVKNLSF